MPGPSEKTIRRLFALSGNICAFPSCSSPIVETAGTITGEICHIKAQSVGGPRFDKTQSEQDRHAFDNLILLCRRHHKMVDAEPDVYSVDALQQIKGIREAQLGRPEQAADTFYAKILLNAMGRVEVNNNTGNVVIASPGAIVGDTIHVKTSRKTVKVQPPAGTIGADQAASRYILYLINRYNEFAVVDTSRPGKFNYGIISKNIETNFRAPWRALAMEDFAPVCEYLQQRIGKTRVAKLNTSKGHRSFSSYAEYLQKEEWRKPPKATS